ncbi:MAG TPA: hypothetical protein VF407_06205 [Polyangiaceae bacterium]
MIVAVCISVAGTGGCSGGDDGASSPGSSDDDGGGGSNGDAALADGASSDGNASGGDAGVAPPDASTEAAMSTISGWMDACLPYGNPTGSFRTDVLRAIVDACDAFGPPETNPGWKKEYCWAHMMGAILAESSYQQDTIAEPGQDPTVGLTQIRFSSVVCGLYTGGPKSVLEAMGCTFPADFAAHASEQCYQSDFWKTTGGDAAHTAFMETVPCNVGMGAWAYYLFATGGGDDTTTQYQEEICAGQGKSADLATGLCAYLEGPNKDFAHIESIDDVPAGAKDYVTKIKGLMDCALGTVSGTHPLFVSLAPNPPQYCK